MPCNTLLMISTWALASLTASPLFAHAGHGHSSAQGNSLWHYVSEPQHAWAFVAVIVVAVAAAMFSRLSRRSALSRRTSEPDA